MKTEEMLEEILDHYEAADSKRTIWMKDPDDPSKGFVLINTDDGDYVFIVTVKDGKVVLT